MKTDFKKWARCAGVRAIKTVAQTAVAMMGTAAMLTDINWSLLASASAVAGILSILTSIISGLPEMPEDTPVSDDSQCTEMTEPLNVIDEIKEGGEE